MASTIDGAINANFVRRATYRFARCSRLAIAASDGTRPEATSSNHRLARAMALSSAGSTLRRSSSLPSRMIRISTPRRFSFIGTKREMRRIFEPALASHRAAGNGYFEDDANTLRGQLHPFDHFDQGCGGFRLCQQTPAASGSHLEDPADLRQFDSGLLELSENRLLVIEYASCRADNGPLEFRRGQTPSSPRLLSRTSDQLPRHVVAIAPPVLHCSLRV